MHNASESILEHMKFSSLKSRNMQIKTYFSTFLQLRFERGSAVKSEGGRFLIHACSIVQWPHNLFPTKKLLNVNSMSKGSFNKWYLLVLPQWDRLTSVLVDDHPVTGHVQLLSFSFFFALKGLPGLRANLSQNFLNIRILRDILLAESKLLGLESLHWLVLSGVWYIFCSRTWLIHHVACGVERVQAVIWFPRERYISIF